MEHLLETYYSNGDDFIEDLLDKISPNWREADACAEIETRPIDIKEKSGEEH